MDLWLPIIVTSIVGTGGLVSWFRYKSESRVAREQTQQQWVKTMMSRLEQQDKKIEEQDKRIIEQGNKIVELDTLVRTYKTQIYDLESKLQFYKAFEQSAIPHIQLLESHINAGMSSPAPERPYILNEIISKTYSTEHH